MEKEVQSGSTSAASTVKSGALDVEKGEFEAKLQGLPEKYRQEILKQYDLPETKASLISILKYATGIEVLFMVVGTLMSIGSGTSPSLSFSHNLPSHSFTNTTLKDASSCRSMILTFRCRTTFNDGGLWRFNECLWRDCNSWLLHCNKRFLNRRIQ